MPIITQIVCDRCQAVKRDVNHWYTLTTSAEGVQLQPLNLTLQGGTKAVSGLEKQYLCGSLCALEAVSHWMDKLHSLDEEGAHVERIHNP